MARRENFRRASQDWRGPKQSSRPCIIFELNAPAVASRRRAVRLSVVVRVMVVMVVVMVPVVVVVMMVPVVMVVVVMVLVVMMMMMVLCQFYVRVLLGLRLGARCVHRIGGHQ